MTEGHVDVVAIPFMPLDIAVGVAEGEQLAPIERALRTWAAERPDLEALPRVLATVGVEPERVRVEPGGSAANALRVARAWGCRAALGGVLGLDSAGDLVCARDARAGIDLGLIHREAERLTPIYLMLVRGGTARPIGLVGRERRVLSLFRGSHARWATTAELLRELRPRCLHLNAGNRKIATLLDQLPEDTRVSLNLTHLPERAEAAAALIAVVRRAHVIVLSDRGLDEWLAHLAPGDLPRDPVERCATLLGALFDLVATLELAVVTRAEEGVVGRTRDGAPQALAAYGRPDSARPIRLVDPTGAGDVFTGTLLASLGRRGWQIGDLSDDDLRQVLVRSSVAAALNCERLGAIAEIPTPDEVEGRLESANLTARSI